ncbi:MAG: hypothetical protein ABI570_04335 [Ilumatobacteraceae bacterium]
MPDFKVLVSGTVTSGAVELSTTTSGFELSESLDPLLFCEITATATTANKTAKAAIAGRQR